MRSHSTGPLTQASAGIEVALHDRGEQRHELVLARAREWLDPHQVTGDSKAEQLRHDRSHPQR